MSQLQQGNQPLPSKEANLLRTVVRHYESKLYKKGLKAADQILKKFPNHGETLAMRGLTLNCLDRKEEAYDHVRRGLQSDVKSHVCWHVYGLLYRSDRDYKKAITCYLNALKHDKDNIQILRDLALLQIQMRNLPGFLDTRHKLLHLRPGNRNNWIAFAIGHYLNKNYDVAVQVLTAYEGTLGEVGKEEAYEHSEMLLLKAEILEESAKLDEAVELLDRSKSMIKDKLGWMEAKARLSTKTEHRDESQEIYRKLLKILPDNYDYHRGLWAALGISEVSPGKWSTADQQKLDEVYKNLQEEHASSMACFRIPLDYQEGENFGSAIEQYVRKFLRRGIPSLFSDLKPLYRDPTKVEVLGKLFEGYNESTKENGGLGDNSEDGDAQCRVWVLYYLAQHYDLLGKTELALERIQEALEHTPTVIELHVVQSKILKHAGDLAGSFLAADKARKLDLADRYLNCVAVKAAFGVGKIEEGEGMAALFTKDMNQISNLVEMQCMWYEIACGNAHLQKKEYGKALKKFLAVSKHFEDFVEDQFDFHGYCVRKMTLRSYIDLLKMEDRLFDETSFSKAAWGAIQCYLDLYDNPALRKSDKEAEEELLAQMSPEERKQYKQNKKKEAARQRKLEQEKLEKEKQAQKGSKGKTKESPAKADPDPEGKQLTCIEDPLGEATKFVRILRDNAGSRIETQRLAFEVYLRKKRMLLAMSTVKRALEIEGKDSPTVMSMIVRFCEAASEEMNEGPSTESDPVRDVLKEGVQDFLQGASVLNYCKGYLETVGKNSPMAQAAGAEMMATLEPGKKQEYTKNLLAISADTLSHGECMEIHQLIGEKLSDRTAASQWKERCSSVFLRSTYFEGPKASAMTNGIIEDVQALSLEPTDSKNQNAS